MLRNQRADCVAHHILLPISSKPLSVELRSQCDALLRGDRAVVQVGRCTYFVERALPVDLKKHQALRDDLETSVLVPTTILDRVLNIEEQPWSHPWVCLVNKDGSQLEHL